jgi:uncharacterized membrane protein
MAMRLNDRFSKRQNTLSLVFGVLFFLSYYIEEVFQIDGFFKGFTFLFPLGAMALSSYWTGKEGVRSDLTPSCLFLIQRKLYR